MSSITSNWHDLEESLVSILPDKKQNNPKENRLNNKNNNKGYYMLSDFTDDEDLIPKLNSTFNYSLFNLSPKLSEINISEFNRIEPIELDEVWLDVCKNLEKALKNM